MPAPTPLGKLHEVWTAGDRDRRPVLERARRVSALTIPHLIPREGIRPGADLPDPYQSIGARGVNNLASRLLVTQLPIQEAWYVNEVTTKDLEKIGATTKEQHTKAASELVEREKAVLRWVNTHGVRAATFEFFRHLLVAGTSVMRLYRKGRKPPRNYRLENFQVRRTPDGTWNRLLVREKVDPSAIDPGIRALLGAADHSSGNQPITFFTVVENTDDGWITRQEANNVPIPGSFATFSNEDDVPWIVSRFGAPSDEPYGRSLGEEMLGDLRSVEGLTQSIVEAAAQAAETRWAVSPASGMTPFQLQTTPNGGYIAGDGAGVTGIRLDKGQDLAFADAILQRIEGRVELSFLLQTALRRNAERVTAEEIRRMSEELEVALGGGFSVLSNEYQAPLARKVDKILQRTGDLPKPPVGLEIRVVTGLEALGRGQERIRLRAWADDAGAFLGPEEFAARLKGNELLRRLAVANGVEEEGLLMTDEELQQRAQEAQQQQALETVGPEAIRAASQNQ